MSWPNPFRRSDAHTRSAFGYTFQLTKQHLTPDQMEPMKQSYDMLGEHALERLNLLSPPLRSFRRNPMGDEAETNRHDNGEGKRDLYVLLRHNAPGDEVLGRLWAEVNTVPTWVCWDQIARGQDCFYRYGGPVLNGLAFQSLLGGMVKVFGPLRPIHLAESNY